MAEIPQDVRALAAGIADDIERNGHYQGFGGSRWSIYRPNGRCCIVDSPSHSGAGSEAHTLKVFLPRFHGSVVLWNDRTLTVEVLATLRKIAAGERP